MASVGIVEERKTVPRRSYYVYFKSVQVSHTTDTHDWVSSSVAVEAEKMLSFMDEEDCKVVDAAIKARFGDSLTKWQVVAWELKDSGIGIDGTNAVKQRATELLKQREYRPPPGVVPVDEVFYVDGDTKVPAQRPVNVFIHKEDACRHAALVLGLTNEEIAKKVKTMPVFTIR